MLNIEEVRDVTLPAAAEIHAASWQASHRDICSPEFVAQHTAERQLAYLRGELRQGKKLYLLTDGRPAGIVSIAGNGIENLYVLPELQRRGYGTTLLRFAMEQCSGEPSLWCLSSNLGALAFYGKNGFKPTGRVKPLGGTLHEIELCNTVLSKIADPIL